MRLRLHRLALLLLLPVLSLPTARGQVLFESLLPDETVALLSFPQGGQFWRQLREHPIDALLRPWDEAAAEEMGEAVRALVHEQLTATELALVQRPDAFKQVQTVFLWIGTVRDPSEAGQLLARLEEKVRDQAASPKNPVMRSVENIGGTRFVALQDRKSSLAYLLNGSKRLCAFSNSAPLLREVARRAESTKKSSRPRALEGALSAWDRLLKTSSPPAEQAARFFLSPALFQPLPPSLAALLRPEAGMAGYCILTPESLQFRAFALFQPERDHPSRKVYARAPIVQDIPGEEFARPDALYLGGNTLLDPDILREGLLGTLRQWSESLPEPGAYGLNPASIRARSRIAMLESTLSDQTFMDELGPRFFVVINDLVYDQAGQLPRLDCLAGMQTSAPEVTVRRMEQVEQDIIEALQVDARPTSGTVRPEMRTVSLGEKAHCRVLEWSLLPKTFRPCWMLHEPYLLVAAHPQVLQEALQRRDRAVLPSLISDGIQAGQVLRLGRAAEILGAIAAVLARQKAPQLENKAWALSAFLKPVQHIRFFRRGYPEGVLTAGELRFGPAH